ncbi:MAG: two-component system sensor histidine kinase NtrB [Rhodospirillaceae bacterium]
MVRLGALRHRPPADPMVDPATVLNSIASSVLVIDQEDQIRFVNASAEHLFESTAPLLVGMELSELIPEDHPLHGLVEKVRREESIFSEYGIELDTPRTGPRTMTIRVSPLQDFPNWTVVSLHELSMALKIGQQMHSRNAARSVTAMAAMMAHEVKNPLSGIRGAAQLLEQNLRSEDKALLRLILDETDRIVALVDRMEVFSDTRTLDREPVNIHRVLEHVRMVAENGFGKSVRFVETYDPSLPPVLGNRDQLIQVFLNLVKNACEAVDDAMGSEVVLTTAYQHGLRMRAPGSGEALDLPLVIRVRDNGPNGIPEDIRGNLFDPFVSTKTKGSGLGLPLVAKIIHDHGGVIEFDSQPGRTVFTVVLPMSRGSASVQDLAQREAGGPVGLSKTALNRLPAE